MAGFNVGDVDEVIHGRLRLGIMAQLVAASPLTFTELAQTLETTNGNLSVHLRKLEEAGYIDVQKGYSGRRPQTEVQLTGTGQTAWDEYLRAMRPLFQ